MEKNYCVVCGKELSAPKKMYCSGACKQKHHYLKSKDNPNTSHAQTIRGLRRKLKLIKLKGGACEKCGYDNNIAALEFHHMDSHTKRFNIDIRKLSNTKWETILNEAEKCILVCANCHREIHNPEYTDEYIESLKTISDFNKLEIKHTKTCLNCGKEYDKKNLSVFCSTQCKDDYKNKKYKSYPSFEELQEKYNELKSWEKVANHFGVTRKILFGIRKRNK